MLRGAVVGLRARTESDVPILHAEFYDDVVIRSRISARPWLPVSVGPDSPYAVRAPSPDVATFSVVELATEELAGAAVLTGIDLHNRSAHVGISLRASFRGRAFGTDALRVIARYGFATRALHRLALETLEDNIAMVTAAVRVGFQQEGRLRKAAWVNGEFLDEIVFGLLATEWAAEPVR